MAQVPSGIHLMSRISKAQARHTPTIPSFLTDRRRVRKDFCGAIAIGQILNMPSSTRDRLRAREIRVRWYINAGVYTDVTIPIPITKGEDVDGREPGKANTQEWGEGKEHYDRGKSHLLFVRNHYDAVKTFIVRSIKVRRGEFVDCS